MPEGVETFRSGLGRGQETFAQRPQPGAAIGGLRRKSHIVEKFRPPFSPGSGIEVILSDYVILCIYTHKYAVRRLT